MKKKIKFVKKTKNVYTIKFIDLDLMSIFIALLYNNKRIKIRQNSNVLIIHFLDNNQSDKILQIFELLDLI